MDLKPATMNLLFYSSLTKISLEYSDYTQNAFEFECLSEFEFILGNTLEQESVDQESALYREKTEV